MNHRAHIRGAASVGLMIALGGCGGGDSGPATVASVVLDPTTGTLLVGATTQFAATVTDQSGGVLERSVSWTSSDPGVASVDGNGLATGVRGGNVTISATADGVSGSAGIVVTDPVAAVAVSPETGEIQVGGTLQLEAEVTGLSGAVLTIPVTWTSTDPAVATVSSTGVVTAVDLGTTTVSASADGQSGTANVDVVIVPAVCQAGALGLGESRNSELGSGAAVSGASAPASCQLPSGHFYEVWEVAGAAGDHILINMRSEQLDAFLGILPAETDFLDVEPDLFCECDVFLEWDDDTTDPAGDDFVLDSQLGLTLPESGTYWVVATTSFPEEMGPFELQQRPAITVEIENHLVWPVRIFFNGEFNDWVGGNTFGDPFIQTVYAPAVESLGVDWLIWRLDANNEGQGMGLEIGGIFDPVQNPAHVLAIIDNVVGEFTFFAPVFNNQTATDLNAAVNFGLAEEVLCNCTLPAGNPSREIGYYDHVAGSNASTFDLETDFVTPISTFDVPLASLEDLRGAVFLDITAGGGVAPRAASVAAAYRAGGPSDRAMTPAHRAALTPAPTGRIQRNKPRIRPRP